MSPGFKEPQEGRGSRGWEFGRGMCFGLRSEARPCSTWAQQRDLIGVEAWQQGQMEGLRRQARHLPGMQEPKRECVGRSGFLSAEEGEYSCLQALRRHWLAPHSGSSRG